MVTNFRKIAGEITMLKVQ